MLNPKIPPPESDFIDPRTGKMSKEWYRYLNALNVATDENSADNEVVILGEEQASRPFNEAAFVQRITDLEKEVKNMRSAMAANRLLLDLQAQLETMRWH